MELVFVLGRDRLHSGAGFRRDFGEVAQGAADAGDRHARRRRDIADGRPPLRQGFNSYLCSYALAMTRTSEWWHHQSIGHRTDHSIEKAWRCPLLRLTWSIAARAAPKATSDGMSIGWHGPFAYSPLSTSRGTVQS